MTDRTVGRARQIPVEAGEPLIGTARYDYADAFEIRVREPDGRTAEEFTRFALEQAARPVRWTVLLAHRHLLRLRLGPRSSPHHIIGWKIVTSEPDVLQLEAESPLLGRGVIVARRPEPTRAVVTTYVFFARPAARAIWLVTGPVHRRVARHLLERAAADASKHSHQVAR